MREEGWGRKGGARVRGKGFIARVNAQGREAGERKEGAGRIRLSKLAGGRDWRARVEAVEGEGERGERLAWQGFKSHQRRASGSGAGAGERGRAMRGGNRGGGEKKVLTGRTRVAVREREKGSALLGRRG